ncbi:hypothetical protein LZ31DRAFT_258348 [Colletotrichum somersetense]|nr:hypothetical protein LZ31DRAFT_258348 [Colletotrichum somersetense]
MDGRTDEMRWSMVNNTPRWNFRVGMAYIHLLRVRCYAKEAKPSPGSGSGSAQIPTLFAGPWPAGGTRLAFRFAQAAEGSKCSALHTSSTHISVAPHRMASDAQGWQSGRHTRAAHSRTGKSSLPCSISLSLSLSLSLTLTRHTPYMHIASYLSICLGSPLVNVIDTEPRPGSKEPMVGSWAFASAGRAGNA